MITYEVIFSRRANAHVNALRGYIAERASPAIANDYVERIIDHCRTLATFPERGRARSDLRRDARIISFKGRVTIVYRVKANTVEVLAMALAGRERRGTASLKKAG